MNISIRDQHDDMIKTAVNGGLENAVDLLKQKFLISDKTLRSFVQPQVCK